MIYSDTSVASGCRAKPSMGFLVILNGLAFFASLAIGNHILGVIFAIPATLLFMLISAMPQALLRRTIEKRRYLRPIPRVLTYTSPWWILSLLPLLGITAPQKPNRENPAISPTANYRAYISSPAQGWVIRIKDQRNSSEWREETEFVPHLNIYWAWSGNDTFWIYNSDDGVVYFMSINSSSGEWTMREWGHGRSKLQGVSDSLQPPEKLYPEYEK